MKTKPDLTLFITFMIFGTIWAVLGAISNNIIFTNVMILTGVGFCLGELAKIKSKLK